MKGIILCGGTGTRLNPMTLYMNKHLLHVYDKPMFHYPLSILVLLGVTEVAIVCNPGDEIFFKKSLPADFNSIDIHYMTQDSATGIPDAILAAEDFINDDDFFVFLGDNIFYGMDLVSLVERALRKLENKSKMICFSYPVSDPERFGVVIRDTKNKILNVIEKPNTAISHEAITGMYFFPSRALEYFKDLNLSNRNETEIVDVIIKLIKDDNMAVEKLGRGHFWMDVGTADALLEASNFISILQKRQGLRIADLAEILR